MTNTCYYIIKNDGSGYKAFKEDESTLNGITNYPWDGIYSEDKEELIPYLESGYSLMVNSSQGWPKTFGLTLDEVLIVFNSLTDAVGFDPITKGSVSEHCDEETEIEAWGLCEGLRIDQIKSIANDYCQVIN